MKNIILLILVLLSIQFSFAQSNNEASIDGNGAYFIMQYPPSSINNGIVMWCGDPINDYIRRTDFIFEGRILTDSLSSISGSICNYHKVLLMKKFKGTFLSDTITVATFVNARKNDVAIFWADKNSSEIFLQKYIDGCGFITVCDKKDIEKNVYQPIETAIGHPYIEVHPNNCATQKKK